jgi:7-keto-8-aminopelargonate synthetase-like enzyme
VTSLRRAPTLSDRARDKRPITFVGEHPSRRRRIPWAVQAVADELVPRHRIYVLPINYPTVSRGTERLRLTPSPLPSDADIDALVAALSDVWGQADLAPRRLTASAALARDFYKL